MTFSCSFSFFEDLHLKMKYHPLHFSYFGEKDGIMHAIFNHFFHFFHQKLPILSLLVQFSSAFNSLFKCEETPSYKKIMKCLSLSTAALGRLGIVAGKIWG